MTIFGIQFTTAEFVILCGIALVVLLAWAILAKMPKKKEEEGAQMPNEARAAVPASEEEELVAVLAAAIAASTGMETNSFRITSYQQVGRRRGRSAWSKAGRREQMSKLY